MQLIFPTARIFGVKQKNDLLSPEANIHAGSEFLAQLITQFGSVELALAAYNAGPLKVREWQKRYPTDNMDLFVEMIPYTETREYVRLVTRNYKVYQAILIKPQILGDLK
ncbi:Soluble lytic murein transglycosylase precursor [compost metagenome]